MTSQAPAKKIAVIGAGPMGLICAYRLLQRGYDVTLFERDDRIGGMSASFDFDGLRIERYYHFICRGDATLFNLLQELNLADRLRWHDTKKGFFYEGRLFNWDSPLDLLAFPHLDIVSKLRYAAHIFYSTHTKNWGGLDKQRASDWLKKWLGQKAYTLLWQPLLHYKYYHLENEISAAWIASRIRRVAKSSRGFFRESLGYLTGGSDTLLAALEARITGLGGKIRLSTAIESMLTDGQQVTGVAVGNQQEHFDAVISTIPLPYVPAMIPQLPAEIAIKIKAIENIAVVCVILKLRHRLSDKFWTNIHDARMEIPGVIEYSNLYPMPHPVVYVPYYLPHGHAKYRNSDEQFLEETKRWLSIVNPEFGKEWVIAEKVSRYAYAQPVCRTDFFAAIPPMATSIKGFCMADTTYYYPEDRSISESIKLGAQLAEICAKGQQ